MRVGRGAQGGTLCAGRCAQPAPPTPHPGTRQPYTDRVRTLVTPTHTKEDLQYALDEFEKVGTELGLV